MKYTSSQRPVVKCIRIVVLPSDAMGCLHMYGFQPDKGLFLFIIIFFTSQPCANYAAS